MSRKKPRYDVIRMDIRFNSPWDIEREVPDDELRRVYSSLRTTFTKRVNRLLKSEYKTDPDVQWAATAFPPLKESGYTREKLAYKTNQLLRFLDSTKYSLTGRREKESKTVQTLQRIGFTNINKTNIRLFEQFMDYARTVVDFALFSSWKVAELADNFLGEKGEPHLEEWMKRFDAWMEAEGQAEVAAAEPGNFRKPKRRKGKSDMLRATNRIRDEPSPMGGS